MAASPVSIALDMVSANWGMMADLFADKSNIFCHVFERFSKDWIKWLFAWYSDDIILSNDSDCSHCQSHKRVRMPGGLR